MWIVCVGHLNCQLLLHFLSFVNYTFSYSAVPCHLIDSLVVYFICWNCSYSSSSVFTHRHCQHSHILFLWEVWSTVCGTHDVARLNRFSIKPLVFVIFRLTQVDCFGSVALFPCSEIDWAHFRLLCVYFIHSLWFVHFSSLNGNSFDCALCVCEVWRRVCSSKYVMHVNERNIKRFNLIIRIVSDLCWSKDIYDSSIIINMCGIGFI